MAGYLAAAYRIASDRAITLAAGRRLSDLQHWGLYDVASRTSSFAAYGQTAGVLSVGSFAGGCISDSSGPAGYTCRPTTLSPSVSAGWSVRYYEGTSTQSVVAIGLIYAFAPLINSSDADAARGGLLDSLSVPSRAKSRLASAQNIEQP